MSANGHFLTFFAFESIIRSRYGSAVNYSALQILLHYIISLEERVKGTVRLITILCFFYTSRKRCNNDHHSSLIMYVRYNNEVMG